MAVKSVQGIKLLVRATLHGHISKGVWVAERLSLAGSFMFPASRHNYKTVQGMSNQNKLWKTNKLICGDNLDEIVKLPKESVDLIYIDPPFFSNKNYEVIFGDEAEIR